LRQEQSGGDGDYRRGRNESKSPPQGRRFLVGIALSAIAPRVSLLAAVASIDAALLAAILLGLIGLPCAVAAGFGCNRTVLAHVVAILNHKFAADAILAVSNLCHDKLLLSPLPRVAGKPESIETISVRCQRRGVRFHASSLPYLKQSVQYQKHTIVISTVNLFKKLYCYFWTQTVLANAMENSQKESQVPLYEEVAARLTHMIDSGALAVGSKAPSVRSLSAQLKVSISTVIAAYRLLEDRGRLAARPQSGFYVRALRGEHVAEPNMSRPPETASAVTVADLGLLLISEFGRPGIIPLGASSGAVSDWSMKAVHSLMNSISRSQPLLSAAYSPPAGMPSLRRQVARWYVRAGCAFSPDDVVITCGALEAIHLCLRAVTQGGDTVAIESPTYWGILQTIEMLGLKALEIPTHPRTGPSLDALEVVLSQNLVKAVVLIPTVHNPLGSIMSEENRRRLVAMTGKANVALIEDDIYADLGYAPARPRSCRSYDDGPSAQTNVMVCGGFSKTVAPSLRIGWCMPGKWAREVTRLKAWLNIAAPTLPQLALAQFMEEGGYERHLRKVAATYRRQVARMSELVAEHFPVETRITRPQGGFLLWAELPERVDSVDLHHRAIQSGISICPGVVFSATGKYRNCLRINCGLMWTPQVEQAIPTLARLIGQASP
jgi:DNA-binding transcriptional MocR family regulator